MKISTFSAEGIFHSARGTGNQDAVLYASRGNCHAMILADGVSSCSRSDEGAWTAAKVSAAYLLEKGNEIFLHDPQLWAEKILEHITEKLAVYAYEHDCRTEDLSSTLSLVFADTGKNKAFCLNLGDGMILSASPDSCRIEIQPDIICGGCYVTTTEKAEKTVKCKITDMSGITTFAICSDGAWRELYRRTMLKEDIRNALMRDDSGYVFGCLKKASVFDDHSIIWASPPLPQCPKETEYN